MNGCDDRAISPVLGSLLLVGLVTIFAAMSAYIFFGLSEEREPQPEVALELQPGEDGIVHVLHHEHGERLDGDKVEIRGVGNPEVFNGAQFTANEEQPLVAVDDEIQVIYHGEHGTSYTMATFDAERTVSGTVQGCDWVESETNGGVDDIQIHGIVVNCDVMTDDNIEVQAGAVIIGETISFNKQLDADDSTIYGNANVEKVLNLQNGTITGDAASESEDVKLTEATVEGHISAEKIVELQRGSAAGGDLESNSSDVKVLSSSVGGSITADNIVKLQNATVDGHVYVDPSDFDCTDSVINGQDCAEYTPRDPADW